MNKKLFDCILKYIKITCPNQRKPKYMPKYYLCEAYRWLTNIVDQCC